MVKMYEIVEEKKYIANQISTLVSSVLTCDASDKNLAFFKDTAQAFFGKFCPSFSDLAELSEVGVKFSHLLAAVGEQMREQRRYEEARREDGGDDDEGLGELRRMFDAEEGGEGRGLFCSFKHSLFKPSVVKDSLSKHGLVVQKNSRGRFKHSRLFKLHVRAIVSFGRGVWASVSVGSGGVFPRGLWFFANPPRPAPSRTCRPHPHTWPKF